MEEDGALWLGFLLLRRTRRDLTPVGRTGPRPLSPRATLRTGAVSALWKGWSGLETQVKLSRQSEGLAPSQLPST